MKKIYLLTIVSFISILAKGQITLYADSFSSGSSAGWQLDGDAVFDLWTVNNSYNCSDVTPDQGGGYYMHISDDLGGDDCDFANFLGSSGGGAVYATMTSGISTVGQSSVSIKFDWLCQGQPGNILASFGSVDYSVDGGISWVNFTQPMAKYSGQSSWTTTTISSSQVPALLNHADLRIRFGFTNSGYGSNPAFGVDNIVISGGVATGISRFLQQKQLIVSAFPNPANEQLYIQNNALNGNIIINIYNIMGELLTARLVLKEESESITISIKDLSAGLYILQVQNEKGNWTGKFEKE